MIRKKHRCDGSPVGNETRNVVHKPFCKFQLGYVGLSSEGMISGRLECTRRVTNMGILFEHEHRVYFHGDTMPDHLKRALFELLLR